MSCIFRRSDSILVSRDRSSTVRVSFPSMVRTWIHIVAPPCYASNHLRMKRRWDASGDFQGRPVVAGQRAWFNTNQRKNRGRSRIAWSGLGWGVGAAAEELIKAPLRFSPLQKADNVRLARAGGVSHEVAAPSKSRGKTCVCEKRCALKGAAHQVHVQNNQPPSTVLLCFHGEGILAGSCNRLARWLLKRHLTKDCETRMFVN